MGDAFYRDRWSHDKVVRSTHGVNCTGSCSWKVYVKDGIITWEAQQTDYPSTGADRPEYEPRGCPRGAAFPGTRTLRPAFATPTSAVSCSTCSARRRQYCGTRWGVGIDRRRPREGQPYKAARGKGGLVRARGTRPPRCRGRQRLHGQEMGTGPDRRLLPDPRDVAGPTPPVPGSLD